MLTPFLVSHSLSEDVERRPRLSRGLTDGSADHELEELILARARCQNDGDVLVGDPCRLPGDLVDQRAERLGEPGVFECGTPLRARRPAVSFEDAGDPCIVLPALFFFRYPFIRPHSC